MTVKKISEGAEAQIYSVNFLGLQSILKRRAEKNYRIKEIDQNLRMYRTKNEARITGLVSSFGINSPSILLVDKYDIVMSKIDGETLNNSINERKKINSRKIFSVLGNYAAIMHNNNIAHGDFTPANIILDRKGSLHIIDFGLSDITNSIEDKALDLLLMKRSISTQDYKHFIENYRIICKESKLIMQRLAAIEKRGRYNTHTLKVQS
jgi:Kae1-associated kinase Bud32